MKRIVYGVSVGVLLVLLAGRVAAQKVYKYETNARADGSFMCTTLGDSLITRDGLASGRVAAMWKKGVYPTFSFCVMHVDAGLVALSGECTKDESGNLVMIRDMSVRFDNGEVITFGETVFIDMPGMLREEARAVARYAVMSTSPVNALRSSVKGDLGGMDTGVRVAYVTNLLRGHDVRSIAMGGYTLPFEEYPTAATFRAMFRTLEERTGDRVMAYREVGGKAGTGWTLSGGYEFSGTARSDAGASTTPFELLKKNVDEWGECQTGVLASDGAGVVVYRDNGYYHVNVPEGMSSELKSANGKGWRITDVCLNGAGAWAVFYDNLAYSTAGCPASFVDQVKEFYVSGEKVVSAAMNDCGDWAIVTEEHYVGTTDVHAFIGEAVKMYGKVYSVGLSNGGVVVCCERGTRFRDIPKDLERRLKDIDFVPRVVKFRDDGLCLITDGKSRFRYFM